MTVKQMSGTNTQDLRQRMTFIASIAWISLCLVIIGWLPQLDFEVRRFWATAGLLGLVSAVGLGAAIKTELNEHRRLLTSYMAEARTDTLTGLANRRAFDDELNRRFAQWQRQGVPFSLLFVDVDHFKDFNDSHGHRAGDEMLRRVGSVLKASARDMDLVTRYGGEEFAIVLPGIGHASAQIAAERLRVAIEQTIMRFRGSDFHVTTSIGIAEARCDDDPDSLVQRADEALYAAKDGGRNCCYVHDGRVASALSSQDTQSVNDFQTQQIGIPPD